MSASRALRRLLQVLESEEEQRRAALESGLGELARLTRALESTGSRERAGRGLIASGVVSGELRDRLAGIEETQTARRVAAALKPRLAEAEQNATALRQAYLAKRIERRQAETLVEKANARELAEAEKRSQRMLDDRFLSRFHADRSDRKKGPAAQDRAENGGGKIDEQRR
jgi:flagellar biosynthesis chaperone FliJ